MTIFAKKDTARLILKRLLDLLSRLYFSSASVEGLKAHFIFNLQGVPELSNASNCWGQNASPRVRHVEEQARRNVKLAKGADR